MLRHNISNYICRIKLYLSYQNIIYENNNFVTIFQNYICSIEHDFMKKIFCELYFW